MAYLSYLIPFVIAVFSSAAIVLGIGASVHLMNGRKNSIIPFVLVVVGLGLVASNLLSGRDLTYVGMSLDNLSSDPGGAGGWINRGLNWSLFGISVAACFERIWFRISSRQVVFPRGGWLSILMLFSLTNGVVSAALGSYPSFSPGLLYPVAVLAYLAIDDRWRLRDVVAVAKWTTLGVLAIGLVVLALRPGLVLEQNVSGFLPFIHFRYWGVAPHANALGPIAVLFLLVHRISPFEKKWQSIGGSSIAILSLLLSQSKTAIAGGLAAWSVFVVLDLAKSFGTARDWRELKLSSVLKAGSISILCLATTVFLLFGEVGSLAERVMASKSGETFSTLSGRAQIWEVAVSEWRSNPIFGYGPNFLDATHRLRLGMNFAYHAHNQFLQTLAQSGLVGFVGLMVFLIVAAKRSVAVAKSTRGVSLALLVFIVVRCITEVPFRSGNVFSGEFLLLLVWLAMLMQERSVTEDQVSYSSVNNNFKRRSV